MCCVLLLRNMSTWYYKLCWCTHTHTYTRVSISPWIFLHYWHFCRTCSASPHFNWMAANGSTCLIFGSSTTQMHSPWEESLQRCHLAITFPCLVSPVNPRVAMLWFMPASHTFTPLSYDTFTLFSCKWEHLAHFICFQTEKEWITGMMNLCF